MCPVGMGINGSLEAVALITLISMTRSREMKEWYRPILVCIPTCLSSDYMIASRDLSEICITTTFSDCSLRDSCTMVFLICHLITW